MESYSKVIEKEKAQLAQEIVELNKKIQFAKENGIDPIELRAIRDAKYTALKNLSKPAEGRSVASSSKKVDNVLPSSLTTISMSKLVEPKDQSAKVSTSTKISAKEIVPPESKKSKILEPPKSSVKSMASIKNSEKASLNPEGGLTVLDSVSKVQRTGLPSTKKEAIQEGQMTKASKLTSKQSQQSEAVDLAFLIDGTGSMQPWIDATKEKVMNIIQEAQAAYPQTHFRLAVVVYRDFDMGPRSMQVQPFTPEIKQIQKFLGTVKAHGGMDGPEDINGGFQLALNDLEWTSSIKILVHICDAPCHGPQFHNMKDQHPKPEDDVEWDAIFAKMKSMGIDYKFMKLSNDTDKMINRFREIWDSIDMKTKAHFDVYDRAVSTKDLIRKITASVKESIKMSLKTSPASVLKSAEESANYSKQFQMELMSK